MAFYMTEDEYAAYLKKHNPGMSQSDVDRTIHPTSRGPRCPIHIPAPPMPDRPKRQKYGNRKVEIDGMKFDSQHEADYYFGVLMPRVKAGELKCVCCQVAFDLPGGIKYIADYVTIRPDMSIEAVIDAKSEATRKDKVYIIKRKQMKTCWGIEIQEV